MSVGSPAIIETEKHCAVPDGTVLIRMHSMPLATRTFKPRPTDGANPNADLIQARYGAFMASLGSSPAPDPPNRPPMAGDDVYSVETNTSLSIAAPGVLGNDSDEDADALAAVVVSGPAHGAVILKTDGSFVYTPATDYSGPDSFSYSASDGSAMSQPGTVSLTVTAPVVPIPVLTVEPEALFFGEQRVGAPSAWQRIIVMNTGTAHHRSLRSATPCSSSSGLFEGHETSVSSPHFRDKQPRLGPSC